MTGKPIPIRLEEDILARLEELAEAMSRRTGGVEITRASALRAAILIGLDKLEQENGIARRQSSTKTKRK
ncbi:MAG TPA: hypothetical protein VFQ35_23890 [Polyangiaceae bacterium]|jgi:predicted transcriptional regulator|nr:hypothetical protein [Polyangiaceae bacterium]